MLRRTGIALVIGLVGMAWAAQARAQSGRHAVLPGLWLEQMRWRLEHIDGSRVAMPDPARWPLAPMAKGETPRMILFSAMKPSYLADHAEQWASWGFRGFLFGVGNWDADVWAVDGNPASRGADDALLPRGPRVQP